MIPFALQASAGCPGHAELATALAAEFRSVDSTAVDDALDALAIELTGVRSMGCEEQMEALGQVLGTFDRAEAHADTSVLMLDRTLERLSGHPAVLATIACETGRRAGMNVGIVGDGKRFLVAHRGTDTVTAIHPGRRWSEDAERSEGEELDGFSWRCAHQVAFVVLGELIETSLRGGDLSTALRARELMLVLPLGPDALLRMRGELDSLRARLN